MNNKLITQAYRRRRYMSKGKGSSVATTTPVFDVPVPKYEQVLDDLNSPIASLKWKVTPVSIGNLRRSKRKSAVHKGVKPSPSTVKAKRCKKTLTPGKKFKPFFITSDFPDLAAIDALFATGDIYCEIPVH
jgi:hypothetical protein